jgi:8-oxo-dGTP diphosphatase
MKLKKFNQFNSGDWIGPVEILNYKPGPLNYSVVTNLGEFKTNSADLKIGYTYLLKVVNDQIIETGMSCADLIVLVDTGHNYKFLSIKRGKDPFKGMWALPGGNIDEDETPLDAAVRELEEETNLIIDPDHFYYVGLFDKPYRDPRNKNCVSHAFVILLDEEPKVIAGDDATECTWNDVTYGGVVEVDMAFDHKEIIKSAVSILNKQ